MDDEIFIKLGCNPMYTDDTYEFIKHVGKVTFWKTVVDNKTYECTRENLRSFNEQVLELINVDFLKVGKIILKKDKWGLLFSVPKYFYSRRKISPLWTNILNTEIMTTVLKQFKTYLFGEEAETPEIKNVYDDPPINRDLMSIYDRLFRHQIYEIGWMHDLEQKSYILADEPSAIPLFDTGFYFDGTSHLLEKKNLLDSMKVPFNCGILASEVGSGKTVSIIGLVDTDSEPTRSLMIVPKNIVFQWRDEFKRFLPEEKVIVLDKIRNVDLSKPKRCIVIINRDIVNEMKICQYYWDRIVIDEVHELINCDDLKLSDDNNYRFVWGLSASTGLLSQADLLNIYKKMGFDKIRLWKDSNVKKAIVERTIRHSVKVKLPGIRYEKVTTRLNQTSYIYYKHFVASDEHTSAQKACSFNFDDWSESSPIDTTIKVIIKKKQNKIKLLMQNPEQNSARIEMLQSETNLFDDIIKVINSDNFECPVCIDDEVDISKIVIADCLHAFCDECYDGLINMIDEKCPTCNSSVNDNTILIHPTFKEDHKPKISVILEHIKKTGPTEKVILYTQFNDLRDRICDLLDQSDIKYQILQGEPSEINISLNKFKTTPNIKILLLSIEQAASGINIVEANHVYFAHPIFDLDTGSSIVLYKQCVGRSHRIGQTKTVNVKFFITGRTMEEYNYRIFHKLIKDTQ